MKLGISLTLVIVSLLFLANSVLAQTTICAVSDQGSIVYDDPAYGLGSTITIPVVFHVIYASDGTGNVSFSQLQDQIDVLNTEYSGSDFSFYLAGVSRTQNNTWFNASCESQDEHDMKQALNIDPKHVLNFYIIDIPGGILGWAIFPFQYLSCNSQTVTYSEDHYMQGVVVDYETLPGGTKTNYDKGDTGVHEVGHYLGLYHPWRNSCSPPGDEVDDTPFQKDSHGGCPSPAPNTCVDPGGNPPDPIHNFMGNTTDVCRYEFTSGQIFRAEAIVGQYKPNLGGTTIDFTLDFTVPSGRSWEFYASTLKFASDKSIYVYGILNTDNITFDRSGASGTWGGIQFNSGSSGTVDFASIKNATKGVKVSSTNNVTISNSTFTNFTEQAVYASNSSLTVDNCTIQNPSGASHGIYLLGSGTPTITNNTIDGISIGIERKDSPGNATISDNTVKYCTNGIKTYQSSPEIFKNYFHDNNTAIRLATGSSHDIHDNDIYYNSTGLYLEQSQPSRVKWNNFGWSGGSMLANQDEGVRILYLTAGNTFLDDQWNNFYDSNVRTDIINHTSTTLDATGNYWISVSVSGPADVSSPQSSHNNNAGPGGSTDKIAGRYSEEKSSAAVTVPGEFALKQNFPNPFNPSTMITFHLPEASVVTLAVYDLQGRKVRTLAFNEVFDAGVQQLAWNGRNDAGNVLASGVYVYKIQARAKTSRENFVVSRKLVLVK